MTNKTMTNKTMTFADLVSHDYNGEPLDYNHRKREEHIEETLRMWCRSDPAAKALIERTGIRDAIQRYEDEWQTAHEDEYGIEEGVVR